MKIEFFRRIRVSEVLRHPLFIAVVAGFITCFIGQRIAYEYQIRELSYQKKLEVFKERFQGGMAVLNDISMVASARLMGMNRVLWIIKGNSDGDIKEAWDDYYSEVLDWNKKQLAFKTRMIQYVGDQDLINRLMNNEDARSVLYSDKEPQSLHGHFLIAHKKLLVLYRCEQHSCSDKAKNFMIDDVEKEMNHLGEAIEKFHAEYVRKIYPDKAIVGENLGTN